MTVQTVYNKYTDQAVLGLIHDVNPYDIASFASEEVLGFGIVVGRGTGDREAVAGVGGGVIGITAKTVMEGTYHDTDFNAQYAIGDTAGVIRMGAIWCHYVEADATPATGDPVYYTAAGLVTAVATANTLLPNAVFESAKVSMTNISGVSLALVRLKSA